MSHYEQEDFAQKYESAFFYSHPEYIQHIMSFILKYMHLPDKNAQIVDLGGGTGNFTYQLGIAAQTEKQITCVDNFEEMLQKAAEHSILECILLDAVSFSKLENRHYTHILLKEVIHHIPIVEMHQLFKGIYQQLLQGGDILIITRPQEVDYPLFIRAREIWKEHQPHVDDIVKVMKENDFEIEVHVHDYHATLPKSTWLSMIQNKFWSTFSYCTNEELETGIQELRYEYSDIDTLTFTDQLIFIVGKKK